MEAIIARLEKAIDERTPSMFRAGMDFALGIVRDEVKRRAATNLVMAGLVPATHADMTVADALVFVGRKLRGLSHHCHWLAAVGYRSDPLDQTLVDHVLACAAESLRWLANNPDKLAALMQCAAEIDARRAAANSEEC